MSLPPFQTLQHRPVNLGIPPEPDFNDHDEDLRFAYLIDYAEFADTQRPQALEISPQGSAVLFRVLAQALPDRLDDPLLMMELDSLKAVLQDELIDQDFASLRISSFSQPPRG